MIASFGVMASRKARPRRCGSSCACITPLGNPVVPEVYMMKAVASGSTASAQAASLGVVDRRRASSSSLHATVPGRGSSPSTMSAAGPGADWRRRSRGRLATMAIVDRPERSARINVLLRLADDVGDVLGRSRVLIGTSTAPIFSTAKAASIHSTVDHPQADRVAWPDPGGDQAPGRLVDARRNLAKPIARRPEHPPLAVRQAGRDVVRQVAEATMPISLHGA